MQEGLALVARHQPAAFEHLRELVQVIAFKPPASADYSNVSFSDLPGAFILSAVREPYWMADALIHEFLHNRLFFVVERGELLADTGERYREKRILFSVARRPAPAERLAARGLCLYWGCEILVFGLDERRDHRAAAGYTRGSGGARGARISRSESRSCADMRPSPKPASICSARWNARSEWLVAAMPALKLSAAHSRRRSRAATGRWFLSASPTDGHRLSILESILAHARAVRHPPPVRDLKIDSGSRVAFEPLHSYEDFFQMPR